MKFKNNNGEKRIDALEDILAPHIELSSEDRYELERKWLGKSSPTRKDKELLLRSHLRWIAKVVLGYNFPFKDEEYPDVVSTAITHVWQMIDQYDASRGRFTTYVGFIVPNVVMRYAEVHTHVAGFKYSGGDHKLLSRASTLMPGWDSSDDGTAAVADKLGVTEKRMRALKRKRNVTVFDIDPHPDSENGLFGYGNKYITPADPSPVLAELRGDRYDAVESELYAAINACTYLTRDQRFVIKMRLKGKTLQEVGVELNLTRERIRQIQIQGESKLRDWFHVYHVNKRNKRLVEDVKEQWEEYCDTFDVT